MAVSPCSYDFFTFFMSCEITRARRGFESIFLHFVKGIDGDFRHDSLRSDIQNVTFFQNVILPGLSLLPSCKKFEWVSREDLKLSNLKPQEIFPRGYSAAKPVADYIGDHLVLSRLIGDTSCCFCAPEYSLNFARQWLQRFNGKPIVTLTMRELTRDDSRKTRRVEVDTWESIFETLQSKGFQPLVIRDTDHAFSNKTVFKNAVECPEASLSVAFRMAIYQNSKFNFIKANGPCILTYFCDTDSAIFLQTDPDVTALTEQWFASNYGMLKNSSFPMTKKKMRFLWSTESMKQVEELLEQHPKENLNQLNDFQSVEQLALSCGVAYRKFLRNLQYGGILDEDIMFAKALQHVHVTFPQIQIPDIFQEIRDNEKTLFSEGLANELKNLMVA
jgi:hypothetical protein